MIWPDRARISFPGMLAYGLQYKALLPLKLSLQLAHEIGNYQDVRIKDDNQSRSIFNTEAIAGANVRLLRNIELGALVCCYVQYESAAGLQILSWDQKVQTARMSNPLGFQFSLGYKAGMVTMDLWYQYCFAEYDMLKNDEGDRRYQDSKHLLSLGLGLKF